MKLISWNVNGVRSILKKGFLQFVSSAGADIICLQETKAHPEQIAVELPDYLQYWNPANRRGYSGVATLTKVKPVRAINGMGISKHDGEGRVLVLEFDDFYLVNVYTPNSKRDLSRLPYRMIWDKAFLKYLKKLEQDKPVIFCGDLNVAHQEIDLANPKANVRNHGFTAEEREGFDRIIRAGFIDTFREFSQDKGHYTWWSQMRNVRERNIGWRIDYFCMSAALRPRLREAFILPKVLGSDHCPVGIALE